MATNKRVFTLRLSDEVFDKIAISSPASFHISFMEKLNINFLDVLTLLVNF